MINGFYKFSSIDQYLKSAVNGDVYFSNINDFSDSLEWMKDDKKILLDQVKKLKTTPFKNEYIDLITHMFYADAVDIILATILALNMLKKLKNTKNNTFKKVITSSKIDKKELFKCILNFFIRECIMKKLSSDEEKIRFTEKYSTYNLYEDIEKIFEDLDDKVVKEKIKNIIKDFSSIQEQFLKNKFKIYFEFETSEEKTELEGKFRIVRDVYYILEIKIKLKMDFLIFLKNYSEEELKLIINLFSTKEIKNEIKKFLLNEDSQISITIFDKWEKSISQMLKYKIGKIPKSFFKHNRVACFAYLPQIEKIKESFEEFNEKFHKLNPSSNKKELIIKYDLNNIKIKKNSSIEEKVIYEDQIFNGILDPSDFKIFPICYIKENEDGMLETIKLIHTILALTNTKEQENRLMSYCLIKHSRYAYEREYRMFTKFENLENITVKKGFNISEIILTKDCFENDEKSKTLIETLEDIINKKEIKIKFLDDEARNSYINLLQTMKNKELENKVIKLLENLDKIEILNGFVE